MSRDELYEGEWELLGKGAYGKVFKVTNKTLNTTFAVKRCKYQKGLVEGEFVALELLPHDNIVKYYNHDIVEIRGKRYLEILMEYGDGITLKSWNTNRPFPHHEFHRIAQLKIFSQILNAIA